ncbi:hypothetical protein CPB84DRAFT_1964327 [Gymnopilus junonius]|uniref:F-box domain-containing protein n=1 Tax=Gymnopilus junonius TaxID=109634 RepID=A0A9P5TL00_GYMJU|nr:hypothetical protein CPB84DRAFT_1964327 [Gymnopilus junonius]
MVTLLSLVLCLAPLAPCKMLLYMSASRVLPRISIYCLLSRPLFRAFYSTCMLRTIKNLLEGGSMTIMITKSTRKLRGMFYRQTPNSNNTTATRRFSSLERWKSRIRCAGRAFKISSIMTPRKSKSSPNVCPPLLRQQAVPLPELSELFFDEGDNWDGALQGMNAIEHAYMDPPLECSVLDLHEPTPDLHLSTGAFWDDFGPSMMYESDGERDVWPRTGFANMEPLFHNCMLGLYCPPSIFDLPDEVLAEIIELLMLNELKYTKSTHLLLLNIRQVSPHWRSVAERLIRSHLIVGPDFFEHAKPDLVEWYSGWSRQHSLFKTVAFHVPPDSGCNQDDLLIFWHALARCIRGDISVDSEIDVTHLTPHNKLDLLEFSWKSRYLGIRQNLSCSHLPPINLRQEISWSQLTFLSLDCPLSLADCYYVMSAGCHTLQSTSLFKVGYPLLSELQDVIPKLPSIPRDSETVVLSQLISISIHSHINIQGLLELFSFPRLVNVELHALQDHPLLSNDLETFKISADLSLPWASLLNLSLKNESYQWRCPVGLVLTKCDKLQRFEWQGHSGDFSIPRLGQSHSYLSNLGTLVVGCEAQECNSLLWLLRSPLYCPSIHTVTIPSYLSFTARSLDLLASAACITIDEPIYVSQLITLLISRWSSIETGKFTLKSDDCTPSIPEENPENSVTCPSLRKFSLSSAVKLTSLWNVLIAPALDTINLSFKGKDLFYVEELRSCLSRSDRSIRSFSDDYPKNGFDRYTFTLSK